MRRSLLGISLAVALAATQVADAQSANVTLYGRINLDVELINGRQLDRSDPRSYRLSSNSSRFGLRGTESLGGGLSAVFQIESGFSADAGGGTLASRETYVGLRGPWGTVKAGSFLSPYYDYIHAVFGNTPTLLTTILSTGALWAGGGGLTTAQGSFQNRAGNSIRYESPTYQGFSAAIEYDTREQVNRANIVSAAGGYQNGPWQVGIATTRNTKVRGPTLNDSAASATVAYNFGVVRISGVYERISYDTVPGDIRRNFWGLSATAPAGPGTLYVFYANAADGRGSGCVITVPGCTARVNALARGADTGAQQYEISYTYPLSKRTFTYAGYNRISNEANASYSFDINPYSVAPGAKVNGLVAGMVHFF